jgi:hypothetical protein
VISFGTDYSVHGPTATHREVFAIASLDFDGLKRELNRLVRAELPDLKDRLEAAGAPWTPGRPVPEWKGK